VRNDVRFGSRSPFNPLSGNPLRTRADVAAALSALFDPLRPCFSQGGGRVSIDASGAPFDRAAIELEGFARPLWGLASAAAGAVDESDWWPLYRSGLAAGVDPGHSDYWGEVGPVDQRMVELAAIAFALCVSPDVLWTPCDPLTKSRLIDYLQTARRLPFSNNNWKFFRVLIDLGLQAVGESPDPDLTQTYLGQLDEFYVGDGWYRDGDTQQLDHYIGFAFHFYGLLFTRFADGEFDRKEQFRQRARLFAQQFIHWFADDGAALPYGRSLTYRFACAGFWAACAFANVEVLPWPVMKGLYLRHLRWWAQWPITRRDGVLTVGYGYPNPLMAESYNSACSPYWAFKAFLPLALAEDHPFWAAEESALPNRRTCVSLPRPGMLISHQPGHSIALCGGQANPRIRFGPEKYAKFAYSTRYAFSVDLAVASFDQGAFDSMIAFADDHDNWRVRENCEVFSARSDLLFARWRPWVDVEVETWLYWELPWHVRIHRIRTPRPLRTIEGGFSVPCLSQAAQGNQLATFGPLAVEPTRCCYRSVDDFSGIVDLSPRSRQAYLQTVEANSNLLHPGVVVPQLRGPVNGEMWLITAVLASLESGEATQAWDRPLAVPTVPPPRF